MFELWRPVASGEHDLVALHGHQVLAPAGPLAADQDPRVVLARYRNQHHHPPARVAMANDPGALVRESTANHGPGQVVKRPDPLAGGCRGHWGHWGCVRSMDSGASPREERP